MDGPVAPVIVGPWQLPHRARYAAAPPVEAVCAETALATAAVIKNAKAKIDAIRMCSP
jgi:hypothetical protein